MSLNADPCRADRHGATGIYVLARRNGKLGSYDIAELDDASLWSWLNGRDTSKWAASVVMRLMGREVPAE